MKKIALFLMLTGISLSASAQYYPVIIDSIITASRGNHAYVTIANPRDYNKTIVYENNVLKERNTHYFELEISYDKKTGVQSLPVLMLVADSSSYFQQQEVMNKECKTQLTKNMDPTQFKCVSDVYKYNIRYENGVSSWVSRDFEQKVENKVTKNGNQYAAFSEVIKKGARVVSESNYFFFYGKDRIYVLDLVPDEDKNAGIMQGNVPEAIVFRTNFVYELIYKSGKIVGMNEYTIDDWDVQAISTEYIQAQLPKYATSRTYTVTFGSKNPKNTMLTKKNINSYLKLF